MNSPYLKFQLGATRALVKFIRDHKGDVDRDLAACLDKLESGNTGEAVRHARMVKPHGMGGLTDWVPRLVSDHESVEYNEQVLLALTNEWCRVISLSLEQRDSVSRTLRKEHSRLL